MAARAVGALLYAAAAAGAAAGALALGGALDTQSLREAAPLAAVLGGALGAGVNSHWPTRAGAALLTGVLTALVGLVFFCGLFLLGSTFIEAFLGHSATDAIAGASRRLGERLPLAAPLAMGGFGAAGLVMWLLGLLGRTLFGAGRASAQSEPASEQAGAK